MGLNPQKGAIGFASQAAFDTLNTTIGDYKFLLCMVLPQLVNRETMRMPPEIGGVRGNSGTIITGFTTGDQFAIIPRGKEFGTLLKSLCGTVATSSGDPEAGVNTITHTPNDARQYLSVVRRVENQWTEAIRDCVVGAMEFDFAAGRPLNVTLALLGRNAGQFSALADGTITSLWDTSSPLLCVGDDTGSGPYIKLEGTTLSATSWGGVRRARVRLSNEVEPDGFVVGSMWQPGFTYKDLVLTLEAEVAVVDHNLYQRVYYATTSAPAGRLDALTALAQTIRCGSFAFKAKSPNNIPGKAVPYSLEIKSDNPNLELTALPVACQGNNIVICTLSGNMKLHSDGSSYQVIHVTDAAAP